MKFNIKLPTGKIAGLILMRFQVLVIIYRKKLRIVGVTDVFCTI